MIDALKSANAGVRFVLELCALAALAYWGYQAGKGQAARLALAAGAPVAAAATWGMLIAPKAPYVLPEPFRLVASLAVFGLAAASLVAAGKRELGLAFAAVAAINTALIYAWRQN
ncbi:MAG: YrdB family protein [Dehalococcoidia bacterium]